MNLSYHLVNDNLNSYPNQFKDCGNKKYWYYSYIVIYRWKKTLSKRISTLKAILMTMAIK